MEEVIDQNTPTIEKQPTPAKQTWRQYLETEQATRMVYLIFGFVAIVIVMWFLQFRTTAVCCGDWDGYYHIRWSSLLWENFSQFKWLPTFQWLPLTVLNPQHYNDHHFLFHLLQIPFLWFFEPVMAAKVAAVVFSSSPPPDELSRVLGETRARFVATFVTDSDAIAALLEEALVDPASDPPKLPMGVLTAETI